VALMQNGGKKDLAREEGVWGGHVDGCRSLAGTAIRLGRKDGDREDLRVPEHPKGLSGSGRNKEV